MVFVATRALHGLFYVTNRASLRSLSWAVGYACVLGLLGQAAWALGRAA